MSQGPVVKVFTPGGKFVGQLINPVVDMDPDHYYELTGELLDENGQPFTRVEFNPQARPYTLDISQVKQCGHTTLQGGYVQRGRQPIRITASCKLDS
jgi:hypothetical protein